MLYGVSIDPVSQVRLRTQFLISDYLGVDAKNTNAGLDEMRDVNKIDEPI